MQRDDALALLSRLHSAQNAFYGGGGNTALRKVLSPDVAWHIPGHNAIAGTYQGIETVLGYFARRRQLVNSRLHCHAVLTGDADHIAAVTDGSAIIDGSQRAWSTVGLYRTTSGLIASCHLLPLNAAEFDELWQLAGRGPVSRSQFRVPPRHCDAQGIMHASRYYEYFEDAFLDWLDTFAAGWQPARNRDRPCRRCQRV